MLVGHLKSARRWSVVSNRIGTDGALPYHTNVSFGHRAARRARAVLTTLPDSELVLCILHTIASPRSFRPASLIVPRHAVPSHLPSPRTVHPLRRRCRECPFATARRRSLACSLTPTPLGARSPLASQVAALRGAPAGPVVPLDAAQTTPPTFELVGQGYCRDAKNRAYDYASSTKQNTATACGAKCGALDTSYLAGYEYVAGKSLCQCLMGTIDHVDTNDEVECYRVLVSR